MDWDHVTSRERGGVLDGVQPAGKVYFAEQKIISWLAFFFLHISPCIFAA